NKAIELNSNYEIAWYNRACDYALLGDRKQAIENLRRAIELNPENREWAKTETDFDSVREDEQFRSLVEE
ncbi:MAG TPA: tetratricopeptide repeat protein, partial [Allocoleopsis sp.]